MNKIIIFSHTIEDGRAFYIKQHTRYKIYILSNMSSAKVAGHFTEQDIAQIIKLEQLFHTKYLTADLLHELIALYVRAIDIFNNQFTFMRPYFL